jgi:phospholipase/lecithinase/hemolysin
MIQQLITHINNQSSSDKDTLTTEHLKEISKLHYQNSGLTNTLETKVAEINSLNKIIANNKSEFEGKFLEQLNVIKTLSSYKKSSKTQIQSLTEEFNASLKTEIQSFQELEIKFNLVQVSN